LFAPAREPDLKRAFIRRSGSPGDTAVMNASSPRFRAPKPTRAWPRRSMRPRLRSQLCAVAAAALVTAAPAAVAGGRDDHDRAREAVRAGEVMPLGEVLGRIASAYPGQVLEVELEREDGRWIYELRLLAADGRLLRLELDARTAEVLRVRQRDARR
jgi:uncharacterized membrane protein YkoI